MKTGLDRLLDDRSLRASLKGRRVALLGHPASVTPTLTHALDALRACDDITLTAAFGPQHGLKGDKQDNMKETPDAVEARLGLPVFSLYGAVRRPTPQMMDTFDVLLVDLQDLGCRIYTFLTTLRYVLEACAACGKEVWVLDRPNPLGRTVEGLRLKEGWDSFVGAGPFPMAHGLTLGEMAGWFVAHLKLDVALHVVRLEGWNPEAGWPVASRVWVNPSPNAPNPWMARCYPGTVMLEGTTLSEGRGTTRPLEVMGAPELRPEALLERMRVLAPAWGDGCTLRPCWFEPTFHKHAGLTCGGIHIHTEEAAGYDPARFRPWRLVALSLKALRSLHPGYPLWRDFAYEYEYERLAFDVINGSPLLRQWVDDGAARAEDLEVLARADETAWQEERRPFLLYPSPSFSPLPSSLPPARPSSPTHNHDAKDIKDIS